MVLNINQIRGWVAEAGQIGLRYFRHVEAEWKGIANPVTVADREIEQFLSARIRQAYPDHGIIGEEYGTQSLEGEYLWTIDPIDGTRGYVEGLSTWSITVALLHHRVPIFGLVYLPCLDDWTYTEGDDVIHNGESVRTCLKSSWRADSFLFSNSDINSWYDIQFARMMGLGSTAAHCAYLVRGTSVAGFFHRSYVWDIAAGAAMLNRQGGEMRLLSGEKINFRTMDLTKRIDEGFVCGHPDVTRRLIPLIQARPEQLIHPEW